MVWTPTFTQSQDQTSFSEFRRTGTLPTQWGDNLIIRWFSCSVQVICLAKKFFPSIHSMWCGYLMFNEYRVSQKNVPLWDRPSSHKGTFFLGHLVEGGFFKNGFLISKYYALWHGPFFRRAMPWLLLPLCPETISFLHMHNNFLWQ